MLDLTIFDFLKCVPRPTWTTIRESKSELINHIQRHNYGRFINFRGEGWYHEYSDTFLLVRISIGPISHHHVWLLYFWKEHMKCDFELSGTRKQLCDHVVSRNPDCVGIIFGEEGWYQGGGDTFYLANRNDEWKLYYWIGYDPRHEFGDEYVEN